MTIGYLLWLIGVAIAVVIGLSVFFHFDVPVVMPAITSVTDTTRALFIALGLVVISKFL
ncbi:MAG: hypothetical protein ACLPPF_19875 [Rhodomicrobium sp.]